MNVELLNVYCKNDSGFRKPKSYIASNVVAYITFSPIQKLKLKVYIKGILRIMTPHL